VVRNEQEGLDRIFRLVFTSEKEWKKYVEEARRENLLQQVDELTANNVLSKILSTK